MLCEIADLIVEVPEAGGLSPRCQSYRYSGDRRADIIICLNQYNKLLYPACTGENMIAYMESGRLFHSKLLEHEGFYLHSSAVALNGRAYLFSGPSGMGKSTHTCLWQQCFEGVQVFNDDKPALRLIDGHWLAYGTPWCGKDGININMRVPLAGICFLKQASENRIRRLTQQEAASRIISQTIHFFKNLNRLDLMLSHVDKLVRTIPVFELENRPEPAAAMLSYETMYSAAKEFGL